MRLDEIYTAVQLLDRRAASQYFADEDALQEQYRESGKRGFSVTSADKKPGLQVANEQQYLMVLGGPGVGKSTFLRKVGLEALRTLGRRDFAGKDPGNLLVPQEIFYEHPCIPVMLELRQFDKPDLSIQAVISEELSTCGFPAAEELTELFLKNGKLLVLLDGLDEVPTTTLDHVLKEIRGLVDRYSDNRYIASCRVAAYTFGGFTRFKDVAMAAFEDEQIEQFIKNWFQKDRDLEVNTAERCWELLNSNDYRAAKELAQTPLLLTLLCVVYDEFQDFPKKRHALYGEALDVLLRKWASEKRIQRNPIYQELSAELELDMLAEIAYTSFVDDQFFFAKDRLINQIREFLVDNLNAPSHLDTETVLKEIEIQQGILVERVRDAYSFSHLTFQEYLTAKCLVDNQKIDQLVRNHITEQHWREVFLLVAGLAPGKRGADELLLVMEQHAKAYAANSTFKIIVTWASTVTKDSLGHDKAFEKRVAAVFLALAFTLPLVRALNLVRSLVFALDLDLTLGRARAIELALNLSLDLNLPFSIAKEYQRLEIFDAGLSNSLIIDLSSLENVIPDDKSPLPKRKEFAFKILKCFSTNLKFDFQAINFSEKEIQELTDYFYVLELMIRCKEAAKRVSPQVWEGIESRMVTVPD
ncbi:hypothetical protein IQ273_26220 [Nodosilinea sp. LEGE 07298]|uniref:NACHT domain-containing protein n=1 Tax=Nodosilinea sp. LEGE 07298 TaxID=2777970 RepID=UPI00187E6497|nr:NACHT domain-containing protein [Nodosilinea sp. LEGE 07298]MBE9112887.1 hypothetical protein [Nodosilinea sp. LEGE 07298]